MLGTWQIRIRRSDKPKPIDGNDLFPGEMGQGLRTNDDAIVISYAPRLVHDKDTAEAFRVYCYGIDNVVICYGAVGR